MLSCESSQSNRRWQSNDACVTVSGYGETTWSQSGWNVAAKIAYKCGEKVTYATVFTLAPWLTFLAHSMASIPRWKRTMLNFSKIELIVFIRQFFWHTSSVNSETREYKSMGNFICMTSIIFKSVFLKMLPFCSWCEQPVLPAKTLQSGQTTVVLQIES